MMIMRLLMIIMNLMSENIEGVVVEPDIHNDDDYDDEEEFSGIKFHGVNKNYELVCHHCHYVRKYGGAKNSICNFR